MTKILVVGCAGAVGSHLCEILVEGGGIDAVVGVDDMGSLGSWWHHLPREGDGFGHELCDPQEGAAAAIARHRPDVVVHLFSADDDRHAHLRSHGLCLEQAALCGTKAYVYGSDCHIYSTFATNSRRGRSGPRLRDALGESSASRAITHRMGEDMLRVYTDLYSLRGVCVRLPSVYGSRSTEATSPAMAVLRAAATGCRFRGADDRIVASPRSVLVDFCAEIEVARRLAGVILDILDVRDGAAADSPPRVEYLGGGGAPMSLHTFVEACEAAVAARRPDRTVSASPAARPEGEEEAEEEDGESGTREGEPPSEQILRMPNLTPSAKKRAMASLTGTKTRLCAGPPPVPLLVAELGRSLDATLDMLMGGMHVQSLCCFAAFGRSAALPENTVLYVCELARCFDRVVVVTNADRGGVSRATGGLPPNAVVWQVPHVGGRDFGLYWRVLAPLADVRHGRAADDGGRFSHIRRVALVNDSCRIVRTLRPLFEWEAKRREQGRTVAFWGVTASSDPTEHLQSYFLVFEGPAALRALFDFVQGHDPLPYVDDDSIRPLIEAFELGLSRHMADAGFAVPDSAPFTTDGLRALPAPTPSSILGSNPSHCMWDRMLAAGCPLVKNRRHTLPDEEKFIRRHTALHFLPRHG